MAIYPGIQVYGGDIVSADDINANIPTIYTKENAQTRNTTTTLANDAELANIPLQVGVYEIELMMFHSSAFTNVSGTIKTSWIFTGTWNSPIRASLGTGNDNVTVVQRSTSLNAGGWVADSATAVYGADGTAQYAVAREIARNVVVTAAGNLSLQWAQQVSNANDTRVLAGSHFYVRKISN